MRTRSAIPRLAPRHSRRPLRGWRGALLPEALVLLCLVAVAGAVTAQALAAVLTLGDRAAAAGRGMLLVEGALETERAHACVERRLPLLPLPPGITLSHERAGGNGRQQVHLVATWASPRGGGGRTVAAQDGVAACP